MRTYAVVITFTNGKNIERNTNNLYLAKRLMKMFLESKKVSDARIRATVSLS